MSFAEMLTAIIIYVVFVAVIGYIIAVIPLWQIFKKAGEPGWKALIPLYSTYMLYKISWKPSMFWITLLLSVIGAILMSLTTDTIIVPIIAWLVYIAAIVVGIMLYHKLSKSFGHGAGFTVGLIFLWLIFLYILAFGSSEYQGAQE